MTTAKKARPTAPSALRLARLRAGFTLEAAAARVPGCSRSTLSAYERGMLPPPGLLRKLAGIYGVTVQSLHKEDP
jgi:transcriptional regulator with XRE-family HTH domain